MSQDTESLEREVESRRSTVESTIEELRSRMSVGQIVDEFSGFLKEGQAGALAQNLGRQVRDNPLALGLVGAGIAWLLMGDGVRSSGKRLADRYGDWRDDDDASTYRSSSYRGVRDEGYAPDYTSDMDDGFSSSREGARYAGDMPYRVGGSGQMDYADRSDVNRDTSGDGPGLADRAWSAASDMRDRVADGASAASSGLSSAAEGIGSTASDIGSGAMRYGRNAADAAWRAEQAAVHGAMQGARYAGRSASRFGQRAQRTFVETLQDEPLVIGAIAVAIGAAIGASLPSTDVEDEYLGDARDRLRDQAYEYGKDAVESAQHVATETVRAASEAVDEKGLRPSAGGETLAEKVASVVSTATETAKSEAKKEGLI